MSLIQSVLRLFRLSPSPRDDFWYGPVGQPTAAGIPVDEAVAMTFSACWAATRLLATSGSMIPLKLMRKLDEGGSEPADDLRRYWMVHDQFNPDMTNMMLRSTMLSQQINGGNCYAEIVFNGAGQAASVYPIHHSRIPPRTNIKRDSEGVFYLVNNDDGTKTKLRAWEMLHVPSPISSDGIAGLGVVSQARLTIGLGIASETQGASYFGNGARPSYVIETVNNQFKSKEDREDYRRQWMEVHGGPANNGKPALLPPGAKLHALQFSAEDSQFLETRQFSVEDVARWYGVPPHLIGHLLRSTYNNIEHQSLEFVKYSLMPWLVLWEQELNRKLLSPDERKFLFFRHNVDALERGDLQTRTNALKEQFFNGKITLNEWRALDDQNPIGPEGDLHFVQQAMIPLEIAAKGPQQPAQAAPKDEPGEDDDGNLSPPAWQEEVRRLRKAKGLPDVDVDEHYWGHPPDRDEDGQYVVERLGDVSSARAMLDKANEMLASISSQGDQRQRLAAATLEVVEDVLRLMLERDSRDAIEAAKQPSSFLKWMDDFYSGHAKRMHLALAKPIKACLVASGAGEAIDDKVGTAIGLHISAGREALLQAASVPADQFPEAVESCVGSWQRREVLTYLGGLSNGKH